MTYKNKQSISTWWKDAAMKEHGVLGLNTCDFKQNDFTLEQADTQYVWNHLMVWKTGFFLTLKLIERGEFWEAGS